MVEILNTYAVLWLAVGCAGFILCLGVRLCIKEGLNH